MKTVRYEYDITVDGEVYYTARNREDARYAKRTMKRGFVGQTVQIVQKKFELATEKVVR